MPTPDEYRRAMVLVTSEAVTDGLKLLSGSTDRLLTGLTPLVAYYSDGTAALAADQYDELRDAARVRTAWRASPVVRLREEKIRVGGLWAAEPLQRATPDLALAEERLGEVIQLETARPFRDTTTTNVRRDPGAIGWQRITARGCDFCQFLAARGAVYRADTARFAAHPNCGCSAAPVFDGQQGEEASVMQYVASARRRTPEQQQRLRDAIAAMSG